MFYPLQPKIPYWIGWHAISPVVAKHTEQWNKAKRNKTTVNNSKEVVGKWTNSENCGRLRFYSEEASSFGLANSLITKKRKKKSRISDFYHFCW